MLTKSSSEHIGTLALDVLVAFTQLLNRHLLYKESFIFSNIALFF